MTNQPQSNSTTQTRSQSSTPNQRTKIILILDESGSMMSQRDQVINGINEMITQQQQDKDLLPITDFVYVKFSDIVSQTTEQPLDRCKHVTYEDYYPSGMTALWDAIGKTIQRYKDEKNAVVCIATDGMENSSRQYNRKTVVDMIQDQRTNKNWSFIYLSEDIDSFEQGNQIGITKQATMLDSIRTNQQNTCVGKSNLGNYLATSTCQAAISSHRRSKINPKAAIDTSHFPYQPQPNPQPNPQPKSFFSNPFSSSFATSSCASCHPSSTTTKNIGNQISKIRHANLNLN